MKTLLAMPLLLAALAPLPAAAENGLTVYGGWRAGGALDDEVGQRSVRLRDGAAASIALDLAYDASRQLQLFASRQRTSLTATPIGGGTLRLPVRVTYFHFGGTNFFDGPAGAGPYVAGGIGFTHLAPGLDGFDSEARPSLSIALGYAVPFGSRVALRVEGRGYWTLVNGAGGLFCSGGCTVLIKGDTLQQLEMLVGFAFRF